MNSEKTVILIISDLHLGGGRADPGDDHVYQGAQLRKFIQMQGVTPEGKNGDIELFINGDFLEFAQVLPEVYQLGSSEYWCSEVESLEKLEAILSGHAEVFESFKEFQRSGNRITVAAGNHDVDLYWPAVQQRFREAAGAVEFALGSEWYERFDQRLRIAHGHMVDPANLFKHWQDPILNGPNDTRRLEMCPGTLFMVKFVNWLEKDYPFADNLRPVLALRHILMGENRFGLVAAGWLLAQFLARHPRLALNAGKEEKTDAGLQIRDRIEVDRKFAEEVAGLYRLVKDPAATVDSIRAGLKKESNIYDFLYEMMPRISPDVWMPIFNQLAAPTLAIGGKATTLAIKAGNDVDRRFLRSVATEELLKSAHTEIVVLGHTHQPDELQTVRNSWYFNPGSWTRYVDYDEDHPLSLEDLKREEAFPYELNFIRVEKQSPGLKAEKICYERKEGDHQ